MKRCLCGLLITTLIIIVACTEINNGNIGQKKDDDLTPNSLELWTPVDKKLMEGWVRDFKEEHPNITIIIQEHTWEEYWSKLPLALESGDGPDLFYQNILYVQNTTDHTQSYDNSVIKKKDVEDAYGSLEAHLVDDKLNYVPMGYYTGVIIYDEDIWEQKGYDSSNYPKTWDDLRALSEVFQLFDENKNIVRNGFTYAGMEEALGWALNYQQGMPMFTKDGIPNINTDVVVTSINMMKELNEDYKNTIPGWEQFRDGYAVMFYSYGGDYARLKREMPNARIGVFPIPTINNQLSAIDVKTMEITLGISKYIKKEKKDTANEFISFIINNEELLIKYADYKGAYPAKNSLRNNPQIKDNPIFAIQNRYIDRTIYPGPTPKALNDVYDHLYEDVLVQDKPIETALMDAQKEGEEIVSELDFEPKEENYEFYNDFIYK